MLEERLDRQLRIKGWDQVALSSATLGVLGDDDLLASLFLLSASALGINDLVVLAPRLDPDLVTTAHRINPKFNLSFIEGWFTHPTMSDLFSSSRLVVDLSSYALANKLALNSAFTRGIPLVRAFRHRNGRSWGLRVFTYLPGREWEELNSIISYRNFPGKTTDDGVLDTIASGLALEEVKNLLMGWRVSSELISYFAQRPRKPAASPRVLVVGAGALGNFAGLGLAWSGISDITFMDPDLVEIANLNRQVFFYDAIGRGKAKTLASRLNEKMRTAAKYRNDSFDRNTDISGFDVVFDCVDNFETRLIISEKCREAGKVLISGGTSATQGQVIVYRPEGGSPTPAELLGIKDIVHSRRVEQPIAGNRPSCTYNPNPSVIMTNQIIAGLMVDAYRVLLSGRTPDNVFYNSESDEKILR